MTAGRGLGSKRLVTARDDLEAMRAAVVWICDPDSLTRQWRYRYRPGSPWLMLFVTPCRSLPRRLLAAAQDGAEIGGLAEECESVLAQARACAARNGAWVSTQLGLELRSLVGGYASGTWEEAVRDGMAGEFWYRLTERSAIADCLGAGELLGVDFVAPQALLDRIEHTDARLREVGAELWEIDAPGGVDNESDLVQFGHDHWWWRRSSPADRSVRHTP